MIFCRRKPINAANEDDQAGRARRVSTVTMLRKRAEIDAVFLGWWVKQHAVLSVLFWLTSIGIRLQHSFLLAIYRYESPHVQKIIGGIILFNFVINALQVHSTALFYMLRDNHG